MEYIPLFPVLIVVAFGAYLIGKVSVDAPTEDEMFRRIVNLRTARRLAVVTEEQLNKEIDVVVEKAVN